MEIFFRNDAHINLGNFVQKEEFFMYPHPFSVGYWRTAANELKDVRKLTFAAGDRLGGHGGS